MPNVISRASRRLSRLLLVGVGLCVLPRTARAEQPSYSAQVNEANAHVRVGNHGPAIEIYRRVVRQQRALCRQPPRISKAQELPNTSPCWRMLMIQFNIALARKGQADPARIVDAYGQYLKEWRDTFPGLAAYPFEERALYEIAAAHFQKKSYDEALQHYRQAISRWQKRYPTRRARFAEDAALRIAQCLEQLGRSREAADAYEVFLRDYQRTHGGQAHPDARHLGGLIARLRAPAAIVRPASRVAEIPPVVPVPRRRRTAWLVAAVAAGVSALAAEGLAIGFTVKANRLYNDTGEYGTARGVVIGGHISAGVTAIAAAVLGYVYFMSDRGTERSSGKATTVGLWLDLRTSPHAGLATLGVEF